ncbi:hypothetical protein P8Q88_05325 [Qipengyuania sp. XHP0207]|uniref:hypothetical protein n=1 Tax=Qipengyuania sp. XHP0207 TaxID=3038078 RepID=UPI00241E2249|nr:hypothetical protein [Qipengyuania sp. XHP0207]MDG5747596.1 hypothetical protein [Qipengyuania sp. XHP0207]
MTTRKGPETKGKAGERRSRVKRKAPARSGPIRTGSHLPLTGQHQPPYSNHSGHADQHGHSQHPGHFESMSPSARADGNLDEGMINKGVADSVRLAYKVFSDTVAQGRLAAEQFRHGNYNMRDVPVDVQILGNRMIRLTRELTETTLNILERLLKQVGEVPQTPPQRLRGTVPPFPTGGHSNGQAPPTSEPPSQAAPPTGQQPPSDDQAPPSSHSGSATGLRNELDLTVRFKGKETAKMRSSPLVRPSTPTLPSELSITPMQPIQGKAAPIADVSFEADLNGKLIATVTIPAKQAPGIYSGIVVPKHTEIPLGVLTIEIVK